MRANALGHASSRYSVVGLLAMSAPKSGTFCRKHLSVGSASRFEPRTARIGADRFQLLCTVCDLPRATTGPLAAMKSPDATNMWGSASVALGLIVSATPGALNKVPRQRPLDPQKTSNQFQSVPSGNFPETKQLCPELVPHGNQSMTVTLEF